jgi:hypothetical protein
MWPFKPKEDAPSWRCATCGKGHPGLPTSFSWERPYDFFLLEEAERSSFVRISDSLSHIADDRHFVRCNLTLPVIGSEQELLLGIWVGISKHNFDTLRDFWAREAAYPDPPPLYGVVSGVLPGVDPDRTLWSEVRLNIRRGGLVPALQVEDEANPLYALQHSGITAEYLHSFVKELMPGVAAQFGLP